MDYKSLPTPPSCVADFCLIPVSNSVSTGDTCPSNNVKSFYALPSYIKRTITWTKADNKEIGTPTASVSNEVAAVQRLMKSSGLSYTMHSAGTTVGALFYLYWAYILRFYTLLYFARCNICWKSWWWDHVSKDQSQGASCGLLDLTYILSLSFITLHLLIIFHIVVNPLSSV